ncbi:toll/interleukin-1 receptor domain-containing protein [Variovorax sp. J31P179]|uniref:toll/interleukin-1 receptor domain-containing protein n=1 Tax=Variovorax sp. J31P179 TaxID=3053508 RepID=UPI0025754F42|nr:toll/interleukin-1 receptor domain-containing protein [Variovorax sp. J31P179]MDM0085721.1 toll/interleukin-1 receptor domain-containing protein [Variovorax sp. J31P179]
MSKLNVFTSYAREDQKIAAAISSMLEDVFGENIFVFYDKESLRPGESINDTIRDGLRAADTMLVISTGVMRTTHSWTGFELGFFSATHEQKPGETGVRGKVISICTYDDVPPPEENRRYVSLKIEKELVDADPVRAGKDIEIADTDDLLQLLADFVLAIDGVNLNEKRARRDECKKHARNFKLAVVEVFKTRVKEVRKPQKQFLIRYNMKNVEPSHDDLPAEATIISMGGAIGLFGVSNNEPSLVDVEANEILLVGARDKGRLEAKGMAWGKLRNLIAGDPLALHWGSALSQIVIAAGLPTFEADNSQIIITHGGEKRYRLILTTSTTFYDGTVEASVYLVEIPRRKDYGHQDTTLLLKGLDIVCRFRFLFLESQSDFYWFNVDGWRPAGLPKMARQLLTELALMQTEAREAELHKPGSWAAFVSLEDLEAMMSKWTPLEAEIRKCCLQAIEPGADEALLAQTLAALKQQLRRLSKECASDNANMLGAISRRLVSLADTTKGATSFPTKAIPRSSSPDSGDNPPDPQSGSGVP